MILEFIKLKVLFLFSCALFTSLCSSTDADLVLSRVCTHPYDAKHDGNTLGVVNNGNLEVQG